MFIIFIYLNGFYELFSQSPALISYQAVIWDNSGNLLSEKLIKLRINILEKSVNGKTVYIETHHIKTNANGLISLMIGSGEDVFGKLSDINWASGNYFLKTETDPKGDGNYSITGTTQLVSVPYALFSNTAGQIETTNLGLPGQVLRLDERGKPYWYGIAYPVVKNQLDTILPCAVRFRAEITNDGGAAITSRGVIWSLSPNPTVNLSTKINEDGGIGIFNVTIYNLTPNLTYYVNAYASNLIGTGYGPEMKITTIGASPNTVSTASGAPTLCINTALTTNITHSTTGATSIGTATGLPAGVSASWSNNTITITGTPTQAGNFKYIIPLKGGCGSVNATGTITVSPAMMASAASSSPTIPWNTVLSNITHTTTGATGISNVDFSGGNGLPTGVSASWANNTITIRGRPTQVGIFNYRIPLIGGCDSVLAEGRLVVVPLGAPCPGFDK